LSTQQRHFVNDLTRAAFESAELMDPAAALRDDVTGTLQAAIADPDVAARLGRLTKAERWSGFGVVGDTAPVFTTTRGGPAKTTAKPEPAQTQRKPSKDKPPKARPPDGDLDAARQQTQQREQARARLAGAERAKAEVDDALSARQAERAEARLRHQDARRRLEEAERKLTEAEDAYARAKRRSHDATELVKEAKAMLKQLSAPARRPI
jgi:hypothetical protein